MVRPRAPATRGFRSVNRNIFAGGRSLIGASTGDVIDIIH